MAAADRDTAGRVFISYVRDDRDAVDRLQADLEAASVPVWRDTQALWPGQDWRLEIRKAISTQSLAFLACFSQHSIRRETSYQNEEINLAVEESQRRQPGRSWLVPVRFDDCELPNFNVGGGRSLGALQRVDLFGENWERGIAQLIATVVRILVASDVSQDASAAWRGQGVRPLLLDQTRRIQLDELVSETVINLRQRSEGLASSTKHAFESKAHSASFSSDAEHFARANEYYEITQPAIEMLVAGCTWGIKEHEALWNQAVQNIADMHGYGLRDPAPPRLSRIPAWLALYAGGLAAYRKHDFGALRNLAVDVIYRVPRQPSVPLVAAMHPKAIFGGGVFASGQALVPRDPPVSRRNRRFSSSPPTNPQRAPASELIHSWLRPHFARLVIDDRDFADQFDAFEVLLAALALDVALHARAGIPAGPWSGSFIWRDASSPRHEQKLLHNLRDKGNEAPEVRGGLFGADAARAIVVVRELVDRIAFARGRADPEGASLYGRERWWGDQSP